MQVDRTGLHHLFSAAMSAAMRRHQWREAAREAPLAAVKRRWKMMNGSGRNSSSTATKGGERLSHVESRYAWVLVAV